MNALLNPAPPAGRVMLFTQERIEPSVQLNPQEKRIEGLKDRVEVLGIYGDLYRTYSGLYNASIKFIESHGLMNEYKSYISNL